MYLNLPAYQKITIHDGDYTVYLPPTPPHKLIQGYGLKRSDQYWRREPLPSYYEELRELEREIQDQERELVEAGKLKRVTHYDERLEKYRRREWHRRIHGHWFFNDGEPVYLTGQHYMYLQWSKLDHPENDGYPLFYENQVPRFYFRQLCAEDPFSLGYVIIGPRGPGKSSEEVACQLENMTRPPHNRHAAIQSKTGDDAKDVVFKEKMVLMFNSYPDFFKPEYNHGSDPVEGMFFKRQSKTGKDAKKVKFGPELELGNTIKHFSAKEKALDGKTLSDVIHDEIGKTHPKKEADVHKRLAVVVKSVYRNNKKRGIIRATTTVEEMKEGGKECLKIWDDSNPKFRDPNGYTVSKLYRYFISAADTRSDIADKHGRIDRLKGRELVLNERVPIQHDLIELSRLIRKHPLDPEEAFLQDQAITPFDVFIMATRKQQLSLLRQVGRVGKLEFLTPQDEKDGKVTWVDDPSGFFTKYIDIDPTRGARKILNNARKGYDPDGKTIWYPVNDDLATGGLDPIRFVQTGDQRASKMAAYGFWRYDPFLDHGKDPSEWISHNFMWRYHGRSKDPNHDYDNIIKAMLYWGHRIMPEGNISEFIKHVYDKGFARFLILRKDFDFSVFAGKSKNPLAKENPVSTHKEVGDKLISELIAFLNAHGMRLNDAQLITQMQTCDPNNLTPSDLLVAAGYCLTALKHTINPEYLPNVYEMTSRVIETYFQTYDISGERSRAIVSHSNEEPDDLIRRIQQMINNPMSV